MPQGCYSSTDVRVRRKHILPPRTFVTFKLIMLVMLVIMTQLGPGPGLLLREFAEFCPPEKFVKKLA